MATTSGIIDVDRPNEIREWTYASDIGKAIHALLSAETLNYSLYHVASGERGSNLEIGKRIQHLIQNAKIVIGDEDAIGQKSLIGLTVPKLSLMLTRIKTC